MRLIDADALIAEIVGTTTFIKDSVLFQKMVNEAPTIEPSGDLISRADAVKAIYAQREFVNAQWYGGMSDAIDIINNMPSVSAERVGEWIPCEEKEAEFPCLISDAHGNIPSIPHGIVTITDKKHGTWQIDGRLCDEARLLVDGEVGDVCNWHNRIVAWMPLPKPYRAE